LQANQVREFCRWEVQQHATSIAMHTTQAFQGFALDLERTVALSERTVRSATHIRNTSRLPIPIRWFPHPFFPYPETDELCRLNIPVNIPADASYELAQSGFIARKGWPWTEGHFQPLDHAAQSNAVVLQKHPLLGMVVAICSYIPSYFPIWGNSRTFSWEPFLERTIGAGQAFSWWIDYVF
ncbi:MAG TPA: hypothetical protein VKE41_13740, partial [Roseiflexaceae bacterium]|nr:hypothetical protein [Roseiflexaceae bacterium]